MSPHVLIGECTSHRVVEICKRDGWGRMWVYRNIRPVDKERWGFDNGVFKMWDRESAFRPEQFDAYGYLMRVDRAYAAGTPYLAVVPDLPAAGDASIDFSMTWRDKLPREWPRYLAVQDGMNAERVENLIACGLFAGIFLGGSSAFKETAGMWSAMAHKYGAKFHYARCSSIRRWRHACAVNADSVDSSQPLWSWRALTAWRNATKQGEMFNGNDLQTV